ncbi:MAG: YIP1 family protein [Pseudomonadota bacterium]
MPVTRDIFLSYRRPRAVIARKLAEGTREDRAIATVFGACLVLFIARWPARAREAHLEGDSLERLISTDVYALLFILPLILYGVAALSHIAARLFRARGGWYSARLALFWALLASAPFLVLNGLVEGMIGPGVELSIAGFLWFMSFFWLWVPMFLEAEWGGAHE